MKIEPFESLLVGQWFSRDGRINADEVCDRIDKLVGSYLVEIGRDSSGWSVLYRDPNDGRLWERDYPEGKLQGGGPPRLRSIPISEAHDKYQLSEK